MKHTHNETHTHTLKHTQTHANIHTICKEFNIGGRAQQSVVRASENNTALRAGGDFCWFDYHANGAAEC